jgi:hypothetical protein
MTTLRMNFKKKSEVLLKLKGKISSIQHDDKPKQLEPRQLSLLGDEKDECCGKIRINKVHDDR